MGWQTMGRMSDSEGSKMARSEMPSAELTMKRQSDGILSLDTKLSRVIDQLEQAISELQDKLAPISSPRESLGPRPSGDGIGVDRDTPPSEFRGRMLNYLDGLEGQVNRLRDTTTLIDV